MGSLIRKFVVLIAMLSAICQVSAASYPDTSELEYRSYDGLPYRLFVPKNYDPSANYPLIVFLHGSGEVGTDNEAQLKNNGNGSLWLINTDYQVDYPAFFAAPQGSWGNATVQAKVAGMINALKQEFSGIDANRVVITGLSLGGAGTYYMMSKYPDIVAGGVPMQGPKDWANLAKNKNMNIWHFHAVDDNSGYHPIGTADYCIGYLRSHGLNVVYTRYDTGGHAIWPEAYKSPQLMQWIYALRKGVKNTASPFVKISSPTQNDTLTTDQTSISLSGTAGNSETQISKVEWKNNRGGSGTATGNENWSVSSAGVKEGENVIQILATGTSWSTAKGGNTTFNDTLIVTQQEDTDPVNVAPTVGAGSDQSIQLPTDTVALSGTASDDGLPNNSLTYQWSAVNPPATVSFTNANALNTDATFAAAGSYTLRLTVSDGELSSTDDVVVTVTDAAPVNQAPVASAGTDLSIQLPNAAALNGSATDDGLPDGTLSYQWSVVSGPATVAIVDISSTTTDAVFTVAGSYVLRLTVSDGALQDSDDVTITVTEAPNPERSNVVLNKPVQVDSLYNATYVGENAVDGDTSNVSSRWLSADTSEEHWIEIDLQGDFEIDEMHLWSGYRSYGFAIQNYWFQAWDGVTWVDLAVRQGNESQETTDTFDPVITNKVRLLCGSEDLARVYEIEVYGIPAQAQPANVAPVVAAGADQLIYWPEAAVTVTGSATDDGLPDGNVLSYNWTQVAGPGSASFADAQAASTDVSFSLPGCYRLQLEASDGEKSGVDEVQVIVAENVALNQPVTVDSLYNATYVAANAVDGNHLDVASRWLSANTGQEHWLEIDLQAACQVSKIKLWMGYKTLGYAIQDFSFQVWQNGQWVDVVSVVGNVEQYHEATFTPQVTDRVRLLCGSDDLARVYELEVLGAVVE